MTTALKGENEPSDREQRWRKIALDQLGYSVNLILTFAVAALGFAITFVKQRDFHPSATAKCGFIISFITLALSGACGILATLTRLWDFRGTARRTADHSAKPSRKTLEFLGACTWWLFHIQIALFVTGMIALAVALYWQYVGVLT